MEVKLDYERRGTGNPLVLVHGFPLDHTSWRETIPLLEDKFDVILPDLRGFGRSPQAAPPYSISDMADDIAGLLDDLKIDRTAIAGHSMGGYVALAFAGRFPGRVSALGLVSSQAAPDSAERKEGRHKTAAEVLEKGVSVVADSMTPKLSADVRVQAFVHEVIMRQNQAGVSGALQAMAGREDSMPILSSSGFPLVLIHGDADALIPIERAREIKAAVPSSQFLEIKGAGHMPMLEFARETAAGLRLLSS